MKQIIKSIRRKAIMRKALEKRRILRHFCSCSNWTAKCILARQELWDFLMNDPLDGRPVMVPAILRPDEVQAMFTKAREIRGLDNPIPESLQYHREVFEDHKWFWDMQRKMESPRGQLALKRIGHLHRSETMKLRKRYG